jgi:hypothetical protein
MSRRQVGHSPRRGVMVALAGVSLALCSRVASAQAFLPPAGEGDVATTYQAAFTRGQLNNEGTLGAPDGTEAHSLTWDAEFGLSDRLAVNFSLPLIMAKFAGGPNPHLIGIHGQPSNLDNGKYHGSFQDFHFGVRFNVVRSRTFALTPFVEVSTPTHHYESLGQAVVGRDLRALIVGAAAGGFVDALPGLYLQTEVSHAVVQQVLGIRASPSRVNSEVGYYVTPRFAVRFLENFQLTHDGIDFVGPYPPTFTIHSGGAINRDYRLNHDRLLRSNFLNLGAGVSFAVNDSVDLFASTARMVWGENVQRHRDVTVGANWHFRTRAAATPSPQKTHAMLR